ncbi:MAG: helix-turn-helix transcriptional regulator [Clostridia bacterium]|nr:helix-turn-helix transcriptional regulator [Clostridia bacterium]
MKQQLQKAIDFVDEHIDMQLSLDMIARHIGFSKYYFNHMFSIYTGFSVMEYVRKKKLEYALDELRTEKRILDIALEIGYSSERAFSRAIVNEYGYPPTYFRHHDVLKTRRLIIYDLKLKVDEDRILSGFPPAFEKVKQGIEKKGIMKMKQYLSDVHYEVIENMTVISGTAIGSEPEDAIIGIMNRLSKTYGIEVLRTFGFDSPVEGTEDVKKHRGYEYWLSINNEMLKKLPDAAKFDFEGTEITIKNIPAYRYASIRISDPFGDPFERIGTGWRFLVSWLEDHDFKDTVCTECVNVNCLEEVKTVDGVTVMDIFIPVDTV